MFHKINFGELKKKLKKNWIIIFIVSLAAFFRFYNAFDRYSYGVESIRDAIVGYVGAHSLQAPIVGPFSSFGPFTFGPWHWYHLIVGNLIIPTWYASWITLGITSLLNVFFLYKLGEILINKKFGYIVAFFGAISPYLIVNATLLTNPTMLHVYATLSLYLFFRILKKEGTYWWGLVLGLAIGIGMNMHYQMVAYAVIPLILLFLKRKKYWYGILTLVGIGITFIPLLVFDLNNNWYTLRNMTWAYTTLSDRIYVPNSWTIYIRDLWPNIWASTLGVPQYLGYVLISGTTLLMLILLIKRQLQRSLLIFTILFGIFFIQLRYHGGERSLGYIHYLMPFVFVYTAAVIYYVQQVKLGKIFSLGLLSLLAIFIIPTSIDKLKNQEFEMIIERYADALTANYPDHSFSLLHCEGEDRGRDVSLLFVLERSNRLDAKEGMLVGFESECIYGEEYDKGFLNRNLIVFDISTKNDLREKGFEEMTLQKEYNDYAKWWLDEAKKVYNW